MSSPGRARQPPISSSPRMRVQGAIAKTELAVVSRRLGLVLVAFALVPGLAFASQGGPPRYKPVAKDVRWAKDSVLHTEDVPLQYRRDPGRYADVLLPQCPGYYAPDRSDLTGTGTAEAYFRSGNSGLGSAVSLFASQTDTGKWWKRVVTDRYVTCFARQLLQGEDPQREPAPHEAELRAAVSRVPNCRSLYKRWAVSGRDVGCSVLPVLTRDRGRVGHQRASPVRVRRAPRPACLRANRPQQPTLTFRLNE